MADSDDRTEGLLEELLALAQQAGIEVRVVGRSRGGSGSAGDGVPTRSSVGRVGERIWVLIVPDDPPRHQAEVLSDALLRFRSDFLEREFVRPAVREFLEEMESGSRNVDPPRGHS